MTLFSICMPSNRPLRISRAAIDSALAFAESVNCTVIISDNSGDPEKRVYCQGKSARLIYIVSPGDDPLDNLTLALSKVTTPFVLPMGDDDEIRFVTGRVSVDLSRLAKDVAAVRPHTEIWTAGLGVDRTETFEITADAPDERILEYNQKSMGNNSIYYSIFRAPLFLPLIKLFAAAHPTKGGYCDWAICFTLFACGKAVADPSIVYRYDFERWSKQNTLDDAKASLYAKAGLPENTEDFIHLLAFLDIYILLMARHLPLTQAQRDAALVMNSRITLASFMRSVKDNPEKYDETVLYLVDMIIEETELNTVFLIALQLTERLQEGLKDRYIRFYQQAIAG